MNSRIWLLFAMVEIVAGQVAAYHLQETSTVLAAVVFILSWAAFIYLCVLANKSRPPRKRRAPSAPKVETSPAEDESGGPCDCAT